MSEMVKRAVQAVADVKAIGYSFSGPLRTIGSELNYDVMEQMVKAVLHAMREPTEEMLHAAMLTAVQENKGIEYAPLIGWRAMIDEALK